MELEHQGALQGLWTTQPWGSTRKAPAPQTIPWDEQQPDPYTPPPGDVPAPLLTQSLEMSSQGWLQAPLGRANPVWSLPARSTEVLRDG